MGNNCQCRKEAQVFTVVVDAAETTAKPAKPVDVKSKACATNIASARSLPAAESASSFPKSGQSDQQLQAADTHAKTSVVFDAPKGSSLKQGEAGRKKCVGLQDAADEIPDVEVPKQRKNAMFQEEADEIPEAKTEHPTEPCDDTEHHIDSCDNTETNAEEPPELSLTPKQNKMRTDLEMSLMDKVPELYGVDDSDELAEPLQEDGQSLMVTCLISEVDPAGQHQILAKWLINDPDGKDALIPEVLESIHAIQTVGAKKKVKKKKSPQA